MAKARFDPNRLTFQNCVVRVNQAVRAAGLRTEGRIITSRDKGVPEVMKKALRVTNVPKGFEKWQLPVYMSSPTHLFVTVAQPGASASVHSHKEGDGIRFIAGGSILYKGMELTTGDWMFIPKGERYGFEAGQVGATLFYCYSC